MPGKCFGRSRGATRWSAASPVAARSTRGRSSGWRSSPMRATTGSSCWSPGATREAGLEPHWGRRVLEIRPPTDVNKGTAVRRLLEGAKARRALFAGDDRTDLDAFATLRSLVSAGSLEGAVCLAIASREAPPELAAEADAMVDGTAEFLDVLRALAQPKDAVPAVPRS